MIQEGAPNYGFAAYPKVVQSKPKFRDPYSTKEIDFAPSNIMYDKRVVRGNTYASMVIPASSTAEQIPMPKKRIGKKSPGTKAREMAEEGVRREISTPEPVEGRQNIDIQTDPRVEEITDKPPEYNKGVQAEFYIDRPVTPLFMPVKTGTDKETQIDDGELFEFDVEVEPILGVLVGKILEESRMEVLEEEELRIMREQQRSFEQLRNEELLEAQRLEQAEERRLEEINRRKTQEKAAKEQRLIAHQKIVGRIMAKNYLKLLKPNVIRILQDRGLFRKPFEYQIYSELVPWIHSQIAMFLAQDEEMSEYFNGLLDDGMDKMRNKHRKALDNRKNKKEQEKAERIQEEMRKEEEKQRRREERAAKRKQLELARLKEFISQNFIENGVTKNNMLIQEFSNVNGFFQKKPIAATIGGLFMEVVSAFGMAIDLQKNPDLLNEKIAMMALGSYLQTGMKADGFPVFFGPEFMEQLNSWGVSLEELNTLEGEKLDKFKEMFLSNDYGDPIIKMIKDNCELFKIKKEALDLVTASILKLILKKPTEPDLGGRSNKAKEKLRLVSLPEDSTVELPVKAIVRIRIPLDRSALQDSNIEEKPEELPGKEKSILKDSIAKDMSANMSLPEIELEDKVLLVNPSGIEFNIYIMHQAAGRELRNEICSYIRKVLSKELDEVDIDDLVNKVEDVAVHMENTFINMNNELPVFDYEIN